MKLFSLVPLLGWPLSFVLYATYGIDEGKSLLQTGSMLIYAFVSFSLLSVWALYLNVRAGNTVVILTILSTGLYINLVLNTTESVRPEYFYFSFFICSLVMVLWYVCFIPWQSDKNTTVTSLN